MKRSLKRTLVALLCALLFALSVLTAIAATDGTASGGSDYVYFSKSEDEHTITAAGKTYELYDLPRAMFLMPDSFYYYEDVVNLFGEKCTVRSYSFDNEVIYPTLENGEYRMYATEKGRAYLDEFLLERRHIEKYIVYNDMGYYATVDADFVAAVEGLKNAASPVTKAFSGSTLRTLEFSDLGAKDESDAFMARYGLIFTVDDGYYYLDRSLYTDVLSFDEIYEATDPFTLYKLDGEMASTFVKAFQNSRYYSPQYVYEGEEESGYWGEDEELGDIPLVIFFVVFGFFGFLMPGAGLAVSLVFALRRGGNRQWLIAGAVFALWLAVALLILLLLCL